MGGVEWYTWSVGGVWSGICGVWVVVKASRWDKALEVHTMIYEE